MGLHSLSAFWLIVLLMLTCSGTFGDVEHVFLVGVCGAVPHYTDYYNHVRLGDIIISMPNKMGQLYIYCDKTQSDAQRGKMQ